MGINPANIFPSIPDHQEVCHLGYFVLISSKVRLTILSFNTSIALECRAASLSCFGCSSGIFSHLSKVKLSGRGGIPSKPKNLYPMFSGVSSFAIACLGGSMKLVEYVAHPSGTSSIVKGELT